MMKVVLLCAGFGTRLYPLTEDLPKSLLQIAGRPLLDYLVRKLEVLKSVEQVVLVSNARFYDQFTAWHQKLKSPLPLALVNDGTMDPEHRLGAIRDLKLALGGDGLKDLKDDVLVLAGDNLFEAPLEPFVSFALRKSPAACVGVYQVANKTLAQKYGLIQTDSSGKITAFFEKPRDPPTLLASMGVYFFPHQTLVWMDQYLNEHQNPDAPGYFLSWLVSRCDLFAFRFPGMWLDIGDFNSYEKANQHFGALDK